MPSKPLRAYANIRALRRAQAARQPVVDHGPLLAYLDPILACNLRCPACPTGLQLGLRPAERLDPALFTRWLDAVGENLFFLHVYNWGEPLLYPHIADLIASAKHHAIHVTLSSNLSLPLADAQIEALIASGLDRLVVSLDGASPATYAHYRRRGDFERVRDAMRRFQEAKRRLNRRTPEIVWQFLVFRHNEHEGSHARQVYRAWGADRLLIDAAQMPHTPYDTGFAPARQPAFNLAHPDHPVQQATRRSSRRTQPCSWLYGAAVLAPGGSIAPCCSVPAARDDFARFDPLAEPDQSPAGAWRHAWNSPRYRQARQRFGKPGPRSQPGHNHPAQDDVLRGMAAGVTVPPGGVICDVCPIPFRQDEVEKAIARIAGELLGRFLRGDARALLALALMGGPNRAAWRWLAARLGAGLRRWARRQFV